jgi:hypothetical protein
VVIKVSLPKLVVRLLLVGIAGFLFEEFDETNEIAG